jgi:deoxyribose-phosphate aldolase
MTAADREQLIDRITEILMAELEGRAPAGSAQRAAAVAYGRVLGCPDCDAWGACPRHVLHHVNSALDAGAHRAASSLGFACPPDDGVRSRIDHTLLKPEATTEQVLRLCKEAAENCFASVCVNPTFVAMCARELAGTPVKTCTVVGFPLGAHLSEVKAYETRRAVQDGACEIDMVINIGALKSHEHALVMRDIAGVVEAAGSSAIVKVILEMTLLTTEEKVAGCSLARAAGADFVKTSTGFASGGATVEDVRLMRQVVGPEMGVKAAGGIRTREDAQAMIAAGATRLGTSASVKIVRGEKATGNY